MAALLFVLAQDYFVRSQVTTIPYSDFKALLAAGKIRQATVSEDTIEAVIDLKGTEKLLPAAEYRRLSSQSGGKSAPEQRKIATTRVQDPQLTSELQAAHVRYTGVVQSHWLTTILAWVLPIAVLVRRPRAIRAR